MARQYKIKRYHKSGGTYRAKPHPVTVVLTVIGIILLIFVGISIYEPVYNFIMGNFSSTPPAVEPIPEPEPASSQAEVAEPEPEPIPAASEVRAVFLPVATAKDPAALEAFLTSLEGTEINTVMVDIKDAAGNILYNTANAQAMEWGAVLAAPLDLAGLSASLEAKGLSLAVRMHTFQDPLAARANRDNAIQYRDSEWLWYDAAESAGGKPWLNPYSDGAREYITSLVLEVADMGAKLVVMDSVQFPVGSEANATFGAQSAGFARADILRSFMDNLNSALQEKQARAAAYVTATAMTQEYENQTRYGGSPLAAAGGYVVPGVLPYQFGTDFSYGNVTIAQPVAEPGKAVEGALSLFLDEHPLAGENPTYIPLLQGGNEGETNAASPYTKAQIDAQIDAVKARDISEYILFATDGSYLLQ